MKLEGTGYTGEFRSGWTNLLGAALGIALGSAINHYMLNLFGPALLKEFGWTRSQFALVGSLGFVSMIFTPFAGRLTDAIGTRRAAMIGFSVVPAAFVALSFMSGEIWHFYAILLVKSTFGILTTTLVFTRVVVERFNRARGLAMACLLSAPPLIGALATPVIGELIETEGWRTAYRVLGLMSACGGLAAIVLVGRAAAPGKVTRLAPRAPAWAEFKALCRNPMFVLLLGGMALCNLPQILVASQMNIMLMENGASATYATWLVSLYAITVVIGRFASGLALDRISPHIVAIVSLGLPAVGYVALASSWDAQWVLAASIALVGLAQGAETDVAAILTSRRFSMAQYSFVFSMLMTALGISSAVGATLLSAMLHGDGRFDGFLLICAAATLGGALCFFLTGSQRAGNYSSSGD